MKWPALAPRDRRALRWGAWLLAPAFLWTAAVVPYLRTVRDAGSRLAAERELLARELELLRGAGDHAAALESGGAHLLEVAPRLFGGDNASAAAAALAQYLQEGGAVSRVRLARLEPGTATEVGVGLIAVPLRVQGETDLEGLLGLLYLIEEGSKLVRVDDVRVQVARAVGPTAAAMPEVLSFQFTATGFRLAEPPAPVEPATPAADAAPRVAGEAGP